MQIDSTSKIIPISKGQLAIVDVGDYERLSQHVWYALWNSKTQSYYAARSEVIVRSDGSRGRTTVGMHRDILELKRGDGKKCDHVDGVTLNNRRYNLRVATDTQNNQNKKLTKSNRSGYKGVCWDKSRSKWMAYIKINGRQKNLGYFKTREEARAAYCVAALRYHGEFARLQ